MRGRLLLTGLTLLIVAMLVLPGRAAQALEIEQAALGNIFLQGEKPRLVLHSAAARVTWTLRDFFGAPVASGTAIPQGGVAMIEPALPDCGFFVFNATAAGEGDAATSLALLPQPARGIAPPFGVMTHFAKGWALDIIPLIQKAGITRIRDEQPWKQVEKTAGAYRFPPRLENYMTALAAAHIDPLIMLAFANPLYDGGQTPFSDSGRQAYAAYAKSVVDHYRPLVKAVEIWNEYNGGFCDGPCRSDRPGYYVGMLRPAYAQVKAADPSVTVVGAAAVPIPLDYLKGFFAKGGLDASDAIAIHPYRKEPEGVEEKLGEVRDSMQAFGGGKPIWATEFSDLPDMHKSRDDAARYVVRMSVLLREANVERLYYYLLKDFNEFTGLGLLRNENDPMGRYVPTPAYVAYATVIHQLGTAVPAGPVTSVAGAQIHRFTIGSRHLWVAWSSGAPVTFNLPSGQGVNVVTMMGATRWMPSAGGQVTIPLDRNPVYIIQST